MGFDSRLSKGYLRPSRREPFVHTYGRFYYPNRVIENFEELAEELYNSSSYRSKSFWKYANDELENSYDERCFLPIGLVGVRESLNLLVTHSQRPEHDLDDIDGYLNLIAGPWAFDPNSKNYILMMYYPHELPVYLIRDVHRKTKSIIVSASYQSECWGRVPPLEYGLENISNLLEEFSIIRPFTPPNIYDPLEKPKKVKFGKLKKVKKEPWDVSD